MPHSPNLVPEVEPELSKRAVRTREAMGELGFVIAEEREARNCVIISPHSPFLPEAFGVWEGEQLTGSMKRFQAPNTTITLNIATDLAEAIIDVGERMDLPMGRLLRDWRLDRGITVPSLLMLQADIRAVPVANCMLGWEEHWLFGTAIAKAAQMVEGETVIVASSNLSHRVMPDSPHGYSPIGMEFDDRIRGAFERGRLDELLDMPSDLARDASECGFAPLLVMGGAFDGKTVKGHVLSYEAPFGIGYLVAQVEVTDDGAPAPRMAEAAEVRVFEQLRRVTTGGVVRRG